MKFYGELLIFILLLITNGRVFFVNHTRRDPLVSVAPLCFILSIFQMLSWRIDLLTLYAFILSFLVLISNFHAIIRFSSRLYVDHYSVLMKFWAVITMIFSIIGILVTIFFIPSELNNRLLDITETETKYEGSFASGLTTATPVSKISGYVYEYSKYPDIKNRRNVIIFIPDKRADTYNYRPYLQLLCKEGYTICSADFYTDDNKWVHSLADSKYLRRTTLLIQSIINNHKFMSQREFYTFNTTKELNTLVPLLKEKYGPQCRFFLISDVMGNTAIQDYAKNNPDLISGTFCLDSIEEYKTAGYGCVEQTDPFVATILGSKKDSSMKNTKAMVLQSSESIKGAILKK